VCIIISDSDVLLSTSNYAYLIIVYGLTISLYVHSWLYEQFVQGYHCIRLSDCLWSGLSTDYMIKAATLMRTLRSRGGSTRVSGM